MRGTLAAFLLLGAFCLAACGSGAEDSATSQAPAVKQQKNPPSPNGKAWGLSPGGPPGNCNAGWADCNDDPRDGCETQLTSVTNCGGCGVQCAFANALASCSTGTCQFVACNAGFGDCDGNVANGCETSLTTTSNCRACGVACNGGNQCTSQACDSTLGCVYPPLAAGTPCDDGDACTLIDTCKSGACIGTNPLDCTSQTEVQSCVCQSIVTARLNACVSACAADLTCVAGCHTRSQSANDQCQASAVTDLAVCNGSCSNGVQDNDETGVDCGGSCLTQCANAGLDQALLDSILAANQAKGVGWTAGPTSMLYLTRGQRKLSAGYVPGPSEPTLAQREATSLATLAAINASGVIDPPPVDWRSMNGHNYITDPKAQGPCPSCTAFVAAATMDGDLRVQLNIPIDSPSGSTLHDLSEAQIWACGKAWDGYAQSQQCAFGWSIDRAFAFSTYSGIAPETDLEYVTGNENCGDLANSPGWQTRLTGPNTAVTLSTMDEMKQWLSTNGPLATGMDLYDDFWGYQGGVYIYNGTSRYNEGHAVTVIGFDDTKQAWLVKNSFGKGWGLGGYAWIGYGQVGIDAFMWGVPSFYKIYSTPPPPPITTVQWDQPQSCPQYGSPLDCYGRDDSYCGDYLSWLYSPGCGTFLWRINPCPSGKTVVGYTSATCSYETPPFPSANANAFVSNNQLTVDCTNFAEIFKSDPCNCINGITLHATVQCQ